MRVFVMSLAVVYIVNIQGFHFYHSQGKFSICQIDDFFFLIFFFFFFFFRRIQNLTLHISKCRLLKIYTECKVLCQDNEVFDCRVSFPDFFFLYKIDAFKVPLKYK